MPRWRSPKMPAICRSRSCFPPSPAPHWTRFGASCATPAADSDASAPDLGEHVGFEEPLDEEHEADRGDEQDEGGYGGDLIIATDAGIEHQQRQGDDVGHADEVGAGELIERFQKDEDGACHDAG